MGFTFDLKHTGLAFASSISSIINFLLLFYLIERRVGNINTKSIIVLLLKITAISGVMGIVIWRVSKLTYWSESAFSIEKVGVLAASIVIAIIIYFSLAKILKIEGIEIKSDDQSLPFRPPNCECVDCWAGTRYLHEKQDGEKMREDGFVKVIKK